MTFRYSVEQNSCKLGASCYIPGIMAQTMYELRDQILALSGDDRANLLALVEHAEARAPFNASREDRDLWAILLKLTPVGGMQHRTLDAFLKDRQHGMSRTAWGQAVDTIGRFVAQAGCRHGGQDKALIDICLACLVEDMQASRITVTPQSILGALARLRSAVDRAYPGYVEAGLLHRLVRIERSVAAE